jgi:hypothetical protein
MPLQTLAETPFPLTDVSATQPRSRLQSPFSPLVGWLVRLWASEGRKAAKKDHHLIPESYHFTSPASFYEYPNSPPTAHSTGTASHDDDGDDDDASDMRILLNQPHKDGLTKEEVNYVVNSLLEYLEEAEVASSESGCEEYEYYAPENTARRLRHGLWYFPFLRSLFLLDAHFHL